MTPKILFVGLGGAGQRHLRSFRQLLPDGEFFALRSRRTTPLLNPDFSTEVNSTPEARYRVQLVSDLDAGLAAKPDLVVISTPTSLHLPVALATAKRGISLLVEKPFAPDLHGFAEFAETAISKKIGFFSGFCRRFHPSLQNAAIQLRSGTIGRVMSAQFKVDSYVPAWHPYEDFRQLYACRKDQGGGVLLTEIHELDLCNWYFGRPKSIYCVAGARSPHELDVEDTAQITLEYTNFSVQISMTLFAPKPGRSFSINGQKGLIEWNASQTGNISNDDLFLQQARFALDHLRDEAIARGELTQAREALELVIAAKESSKNSRAITL